jgi:ribose 5-phosphate isomerase B
MSLAGHVMRVTIGADHAGFRAKEALKAELDLLGIECQDVGTHSEESCDYPDFAKRVAEAVSGGLSDRGVLVCGTGIGMAIAANKVSGVRAAVCHNTESARLSREHNDANVLALGSRLLSVEEMKVILRMFLQTEFAGGRHERRINKIREIEKECL